MCRCATTDHNQSMEIKYFFIKQPNDRVAFMNKIKSLQTLLIQCQSYYAIRITKIVTNSWHKATHVHGRTYWHSLELKTYYLYTAGPVEVTTVRCFYDKFANIIVNKSKVIFILVAELRMWIRSYAGVNFFLGIIRLMR